MTRIPRLALLLGLAGLIPIVAVAISGYVPWLYSYIDENLFRPNRLLYIYSTAILCFMAGTHWGLAMQDDPPNPVALLLSIWPVFFTLLFFMSKGYTRNTLLLAGFVLLLFNDWYLSKEGLAPAWWLRLRILLTIVIAICLLSRIFNGHILTLIEMSAAR